MFFIALCTSSLAALTPRIMYLLDLSIVILFDMFRLYLIIYILNCTSLDLQLNLACAIIALR